MILKDPGKLEEGFSREKIIAKLIKRFSLTVESAQRCYEKFSKTDYTLFFE